MLKEWAGSYRFDPKKTARFVAGWFTERFTMKEGYEDAVEDFLGESDPEVEQIRLVITEDAVCLNSGPESERYPIVRFWQEDARLFVEMICQGHSMPFEIQDFGDGCVRLHNPSNTLSEYVWRPDLKE